MGKTSAKVKNRYANKAYDRIVTLVPKGRKQVIREHARGQEESLNAFVNRAIEKCIENDKKAFQSDF